jgi:hypothetical protein
MKKRKVKIKKKWMPGYRKFVRELIGHLQYAMFLNLYQIDVSYEKEPKTGSFKKADDNCVAADIRTDHRYYNATVNLYPITHQRWSDGNKKGVAEIVIHELCHIITDPLYKVAYGESTKSNHSFLEDTREQTTQHIANMVLCALEREKPKLFK